MTLRWTHFLGFFALALLIRLVIVGQGLPTLDRLALPDDTYYTLAISKNIALGNGPSTDGVIQTSGFQPLISLFQIPLFSLSGDLDQIAHWALFQTAIIGALAAVLLGLVVRRLHNELSAVIAMLIWCIAPTILRNDINGLETSLSGLFLLLIFYCFLRADAERNTGWLIALGASCSLALLSRIDTAFLILGVGIYGLIRWRFVHIATVVVTAVLVILPWWIYLYSEFGNIIPESGAAVRQIVEILAIRDKGAAVVAFAIAILKFGDWLSIAAFPGIADLAMRLFSFGLSLVVLYQGYRLLFRDKKWQLTPVLGYMAVIWCFYAFYVPAYWFFGRYFYGITIFLIIFTAISLSGGLLAESGTFKKQLSRVSLALIVLGSLISLSIYFTNPKQTPNLPFQSFNGYRDVANELLPQVPPGSVLSAMQSGALNYYAPSGLRVVNLDGVVNHDAYIAIKNRAMKSYLRDQQITHFADWPGMLDLLRDSYGDTFDDNCLSHISDVPQGIKTYKLFELRECY